MPIDLLCEPAGSAYSELITVAQSTCDTFALVWRDNEFVEPRVRDELAPHLIREERTNQWPGTTLFGGQLVTVRFYRLDDGSAAVLRRARRLYAWQHPQLPEDLAFYRASELWLGSIAHEADGWFDDSVPLEFIARAMPRLYVAWRPAGDDVVSPTRPRD